MGFFSRLFRSRDAPQNRTAGSGYTFYFGGTASGKAVTERSAMQMTAVYSCVRILAEAVAGLPLNLYRYTEDGGKEKAIACEEYGAKFFANGAAPGGVLEHPGTWEQSIQRSLFTQEEKATYFVKFNLEGLLRGDYQSRMNGYPHDVTVKIDSIAASAASVIAMAGTKVPMSPVSTMMIHNPATIAWGDAGEMKKDIAMLESVKDSIINAYEIKTGLSRAKLSHLMDSETWMDANKAVELGFADGILSRAQAEDDAAYTKMEQDITDLGREIARLERQEALDAELSKPTASPLAGKPLGGADPDEPKTGRASKAYKEAMLTALRTNFRQVSNVLQEGIDANGGYLVPEEYDSRLIDGLTEENIMRRLGHRITTSGEHKINIAATKPAAAWIDEGGALTFGDATFAQISLDAHKLHVAVKVTEELLYDNAFGLESYIIAQFAKALGNAKEDAFLNGDGSGKPLGLLAATGGAQTAVTIAGASITADEVIDLVYALKRPYHKSAAFLTNDQTLAVLRKLKGNNGQYLWQPSYQAGEPDRLFGYAIHASPYSTTIATANTSYIIININWQNKRSLL